MGLFNPGSRDEQAHWLYCENARVQEILGEIEFKNCKISSFHLDKTAAVCYYMLTLYASSTYSRWECGKILTLLYEAWLCFLTLLVEGLPLKFNTGGCVCKFDTVMPEPKLVKIGHVTRKCITRCSLYVNVSSGQVTKCLNARMELTPPIREDRGFFFIYRIPKYGKQKSTKKIGGEWR